MLITLNGKSKEFPDLNEGASVGELVSASGLKSDRVAVELNEEIVSRRSWEETFLKTNDKVEIVHFVGGGL
ncbi:MAG: sulfur carrier protein ThiS [Acidobacteriaceae bacterium]|nr:sulfur carrier protein ThiS [Acidobacteriaceae bacterium]